MTKAKKGDVRPIYKQVGWEICKEEAATEDKEVWVQTDKPVEAEILSELYKEKN